ncbi:hypothetical protein Dda_0455 [Drechslerella dactyloides]|uniref:Uncharacterized protein n=1 Tax=Drechslerella dactyloides TaxID=74499 RepID=A0AAD6NNG3_DREDA|nr:hypothetical protein Dda_0455 [Drechslerella dactyloides]
MTGRNRRPFTASAHDGNSGTDDENDIPLDEQEQEQLIQDLKRENDRKNAFFILAFTCLCVVPAILLTIRLLTGTGSGVDVLAISSLAMTAFTVRSVPLDPAAQEYLSPLEKWVPLLNPVLIVVITVGALFTNRHVDNDYFLYLPLIVWGIVNLGRSTMASVDLGHLEKLRYKYKGA